MLSLLACACTPSRHTEVADLVILDADVQTMNGAQPQAQALAARGGRIVYVGNDEGAQHWIGSGTHVLRVAGVTVLPGLIDSHIHVMDGALDESACSAGDAVLKLAQVAPIVRTCTTRVPAADWVVVIQVNAAGFQADRHALDAIVGDRPLLLSSSDGHAAWVNSIALRRAGITRQSVNPIGGTIERDRSGEPNGFLVDEAVELVTRLIDKPGEAEREGLLLKVLGDLAKDGITSLMEANTTEDTVRTYVQLARRHQLHAHVSMALKSDGTNSDAEFARLKSVRALTAAEPLLRADLIKLFADGIMEYPTQTAAMLEPYRDAHDKPTTNFGPTYLEPGPLAQFVRRAASEGFGVHIHAIGDRAARVALDAFADARAHDSQRAYSIAHLELVDPQDLPRFRALNVYASLQLLWARPDNYTVEAVLPYIGPERQARLYPERALKDAGAVIAGGSDWDVSSFNPFEAMASAISRRNADAPQRGVLGAEQILPLHDLLAAYTINAARMLDLQNELGSLATGKAADIVVLDRHLDDATGSSAVLATTVRYTFMNGNMLVGPATP